MSPKSPYIGSTLSILTRTGLRYEGVLYSVDNEKSTIALANVRSFGTEDRCEAALVAGQEEIFKFIVFKSADVKEVIVCKMPKESPVSEDGLPMDPAILSYSKRESLGKKTSPKSQLLATLQSSSPTSTYSRLGTPLRSMKGRLSRLQSQAICSRHNHFNTLSDPGLLFPRVVRGGSAFLSHSPMCTTGFSSNGRPFLNHAFMPHTQFEADYDFEAANKEFAKYHSLQSPAAIAVKEQLKSFVKSALIDTQDEVNKKEECENENPKKSFYNKETSFFDSISSGNKRDRTESDSNQKKTTKKNCLNRYSLDGGPLPNYFGLPEYEFSYRQKLQRNLGF